MHSVGSVCVCMYVCIQYNYVAKKLTVGGRTRDHGLSQILDLRFLAPRFHGSIW